MPTLWIGHDPRVAPAQENTGQELELLDPEGNSRWERLVADLQREIEKQARALYSAKVLEQARNPENLGRMDAPDAQTVATGWCGGTMEIYAKLIDGGCTR